MTSVSLDSNRKTAAQVLIQRLGGSRTLLCLALIVTVIGARFWIIGRFGSDLPFFDQWDGEGERIFQPFFAKTLTLQNWFAAHNEHRIFFSRLLSLTLLLANGQWDARLQMVVNALFYALCAGGLFLICTEKQARLQGAVGCAVVALIFSLPFGWENTIAGFQSQFYFLVAFSVAAIWLLANWRSWTVPWIGGCLCAIAALFSMGSGVLAPLAVLGLFFIVLCRNLHKFREWLSDNRTTITACILIAVAGSALTVTVPGHAVYRAHSVAQFVHALMQALSWPCSGFLWWAIPNWLPFALLVGLYLADSIPDGRRIRLVLGMGIWLLLQAAATAFARSSVVLSSRYLDLISLGLLINLFSLILIANRTKGTKKAVVLTCLVLAWAIMNALGMYFEAMRSFRQDLPGREASYTIEKFRTAGYLTSGDSSFLTQDVRRATDIPFPNANKLEEILANPAIRSILPVSVQGPLATNPNGGILGLAEVAGDRIKAPYPWDKSITVPATPGVPGQQVYSGFKRLGLPVISLYIMGDCNNLTVTDAQNRKHQIRLITEDKEFGWRQAFAWCPGQQCRIEATAGGNGPVSFTEPKEMGGLSLIALLACQKGAILLALGAILFCLAFALIISDAVGAKSQTLKKDMT